MELQGIEKAPEQAKAVANYPSQELQATKGSPSSKRVYDRDCGGDQAWCTTTTTNNNEKKIIQLPRETRTHITIKGGACQGGDFDLLDSVWNTWSPLDAQQQEDEWGTILPRHTTTTTTTAEDISSSTCLLQIPTVAPVSMMFSSKLRRKSKRTAPAAQVGKLRRVMSEPCDISLRLDSGNQVVRFTVDDTTSIFYLRTYIDYLSVC